MDPDQHKVKDPQDTLHELTPATVGTDAFRSMVDVAFNYLRDAIMRGDLRPGDKVPQREISERMQISRMPLREALRKLEERHFVRIVAHRGAFVTPLSVTDIREIYLIRAELEALSAGIAATMMDEARIRELRTILATAGRAIADRDSTALSEANRRFHITGHEATGNKHLIRLIGDLADHAQRYRLLHTRLGERAQIALREHEGILAAWERGDAEAASYWVRINLVNSQEALLEAIEQAQAGSQVAKFFPFTDVS
jgi:DNA-binding GntR family transcriptional regulator